MKEGSRANALLIELLLVILFFMLSAMTLVKIFGGAKLKSLEAQAMNHALQQSQNVAETLYGAGDSEAALEEMGFRQDGESWVIDGEGYQLRVTAETEETDAGSLLTHKITGIMGEKEMFTLPESRYIPREVTP